MAHDRRRPPYDGAAPSRALIAIAALNLATVIIASSQTDARAWWVVGGIFTVSAVCVAVLLLAHRRR